MTVIDEQGRTEPPLAETESDTLLGFLDFQRATLEWKAAGLDADGLQATLLPILHPTTMTLGGILKHMAWVEDYWFGVRMLGNPPSAYWADVDCDADEDWEWTSRNTLVTTATPTCCANPWMVKPASSGRRTPSNGGNAHRSRCDK